MTDYVAIPRALLEALEDVLHNALEIYGCIGVDDDPEHPRAGDLKHAEQTLKTLREGRKS